MKQLSFLDLEEGKRRRDEGLDSLERHAFVEQARRLARDFCRWRGSVTTDDLQGALTLPAGVHVNVWGAILRPPEFRSIDFVQSKRPEAHARWIQRWELS